MLSFLYSFKPTVSCVGGPQDHSMICWFIRRTRHDSAHSHRHGCDLFPWKGYHTKRNQQKEKPHDNEFQRKPGLSFQETSLSGVTQKALISSSGNDLWQHVWNVPQGSSSEGTLCSQSLSTGRHSDEGIVRNLPHIQGSKCQPRRSNTCLAELEY